MILLWGIESDPPLAAVRHALDDIGARYMCLDQRLTLETELAIDVGTRVEGYIRCRRQECRLEDITACYLRPDDARQVVGGPATEAGSSEWQHVTAIEDALLSWSDLTPALLINRASSMGSNSSKPAQLTLLRALGFKTPETLVTTDAQAVLTFWKEHGVVVYKSISGVRSQVARLTREHLGRLSDLATCPTQFQAYVPGVDYRVHVIGDDVFGCAIHSAGDDYRYAPNALTACEIPTDVAIRCRDATTALGLVIAGVDLRCTPDGQWYGFEVNPSPGFTFYDRAQGQPMAAAIARILAGASVAATQKTA